MFSNVRNIFSAAVRNVAAAGLALMIAASPAWAQSLEVGHQADPNIIRSELMAEGHQISSYYNQIVIFQDTEELRHFGNIVTKDQDGDWYLIFSNAELGGENSLLRVEAKGINLTYYQPDPTANVIPLGPNENIDLIREQRTAGKQVLPRSLMLETALESDDTSYLAFSGDITNSSGDAIGMIDAIVSTTDNGRQTLALYHTDMNGICEVVKSGIDYVANPEVLAVAIDLNTLNLAESTTTSDAAQRLQQSTSTSNKRQAPTPQ